MLKRLILQCLVVFNVLKAFYSFEGAKNAYVHPHVVCRRNMLNIVKLFFRCNREWELLNVVKSDYFFGTEMLKIRPHSTLERDLKLRFFQCGSPNAMTSLAFSSIQIKSFWKLTMQRKSKSWILKLEVKKNNYWKACCLL